MDVDLILAMRRIHRFSGAARCVATTLADDKLMLVRRRDALFENGVEVVPAVEENLLAGIANVMARSERTLTPEAPVAAATPCLCPRS